MPPTRLCVLLSSLALLALLACCDGVLLYSSFWAPLFDRRILSYRVDAAFHPDSAKSGRDKYAQSYGFRGERLIADLGNGNGPGDLPVDDKIYGDVKFYYT